MFQTESHARHPLMSAIAGEGQHVWSYVNLVTNQPWFFASYILHTPDGDLSENVMLSMADQVVDLVKQSKHVVRLKSLMLISPAELNKSKTWMMEPLTKIWEGRVVETDRHALVYDLASGKRYIDSFEKLELSQLCDLQCKVNIGRR